MKQNILALRKKGKSYNEIVKILGCSKGTISYHCGEGVKIRTYEKQRVRLKANPIIKKMDAFKQKANYTKFRTFQRRDNSVKGRMKSKMENNFTLQELKSYLGDSPTCYLTGRKIDLSKSDSFSFDHFIPAAKGGINSLSNLRIAAKVANDSKSSMLYEEFVQLCREVVSWHDKNTIPNTSV